MRALVFRSAAIPGLPGLQEYLNIISDTETGFCPYASPSMERGGMLHSAYDLTGLKPDQIEAALFYLAAFHTELLRLRWHNCDNRSVRGLLCENLYLTFPTENEVDGAALFAWPHWILKTHYTGMGILFGKFHKGEQESTEHGRPIPPPPVHMMSIRGLIRPRDPAFFGNVPGLLPVLEAANDDGSRAFPEVSNTAFCTCMAASATTGEELLKQAVGLLTTNVYTQLKTESEKLILPLTKGAAT